MNMHSLVTKHFKLWQICFKTFWGNVLPINLGYNKLFYPEDGGSKICVSSSKLQ